MNKYFSGLAAVLALALAPAGWADGIAHPQQGTTTSLTDRVIQAGAIAAARKDFKDSGEIMLLVKTQGFGSGRNSDKKETRYLRVSATGFLKPKFDSDGTLSFLDLTLTPVTQDTFDKEKDETLTRKQFRYGTLGMRRDANKDGHLTSIEVYSVGVGVGIDTPILSDQNRALLEKAADDCAARRREDPTWVPGSTDPKHQCSVPDLQKNLARKFAELSVNVLGGRYMRTEYTGRKTDFLGATLLNFQGDVGVSVDTSRCAKLRFSTGGVFKMDIMAKKGRGLKLSDASLLGEMDFYVRTEYLVNMAIGQFSLAGQAGFKIEPELEKVYGGLGQTTQHAIGGSGDTGGTREDLTEGADFLGGGGPTQSHPYVMITLTKKW